MRLAKLVINPAGDVCDRGHDLLELIAQARCLDSGDKKDRMTRFLERKKRPT